MSCMSQNLRLFHVSNLSVRNFRIFQLMHGHGDMVSHVTGRGLRTALLPPPPPHSSLVRGAFVHRRRRAATCRRRGEGEGIGTGSYRVSCSVINYSCLSLSVFLNPVSDHIFCRCDTASQRCAFKGTIPPSSKLSFMPKFYVKRFSTFQWSCWSVFFNIA